MSINHAVELIKINIASLNVFKNLIFFMENVDF